VRRYRLRLSGPVRDRIDLHFPLAPVRARDLGPDAPAGEPTAAVAARVAAARERQARRLRGTPWKLNGDVPGAQVRHLLPVAAEAAAPALAAVGQGRLTARGATRALRVAWTLADLAGRDQPGAGDVELAMLAHAAGAP
jgi:magnesium chelatase family protein